MRVVIHADASPSMGTGHVVRSLALASALREAGDDVTLASDEQVEALTKRARSIGVTTSLRADAPRDPDWVVIDGYHFDAAARASVADAEVPRVVIDDLGQDLVGASIAVNQNLYARPGSPPTPEGIEALAGPAYALLRPEFADARPDRPQPAVAERLVVTMGGADPNDATSLALAAVNGVEPRPEVRVIVGAAHPARAALERTAEAAGFEVVYDAPTLAGHLAWADIVVSSCGTSVLEAVRLGRPIVGIVLADNQRRVAAAIEREGLGVIAGSHPSLTVSILREAIDSLRGDRAMRERIAQAGPPLVDGRGARRVVRAMHSGPLRLRDATMDDADSLRAWRNDPASRAASFQTAVVERDEHIAWLAARLGSPQHRTWIGELGGVAVGVVRFAIEDDLATISVVLAAERRAAGVGTRLIAAGSARLLRTSSVGTIEAWIRSDNAGSLAAFRAAGYRLSATEPDRVGVRLPMG